MPAPPSRPPAVHPADSARIDAAMRRAGVAWVEVPGQPPRPVWGIWREGALFVVVGGGEQPPLGLDTASMALIITRDRATGARGLQWSATVSSVAPGSPQWHRITPAAAAGRLNSPDGPRAPERWARESTLLRLEPTG